MQTISNTELIRMLRRYAKWLKEKSDNSFQKNQNLWKLITLSAERLYQYEQYQEETDAYKQGEWTYGKTNYCTNCGADMRKGEHDEQADS